MSLVWILLPAYDEAGNLPFVVEGIAAALNSSKIDYRIVVVDDGSRDGTGDVATSLAQRLPVTVAKHEHNLGLARAMDTGLRVVWQQAGQNDVVVTMDADNTHPPDLIPRMVREIRGGADIVIASRYAPGGAEEGVPLVRRLLSGGVSLLLRLRFRTPGVRDCSSGYRAYRVGLLHLAARQYGNRLITAPGFSVMAELLIKLRSFRPRVVEVPLRLRYDLKKGSSKMRVLQTVCEYGLLLVRGA